MSDVLDNDVSCLTSVQLVYLAVYDARTYRKHVHIYVCLLPVCAYVTPLSLLLCKSAIIDNVDTGEY